jgi:FkbM family methyltransferase
MNAKQSVQRNYALPPISRRLRSRALVAIGNRLPEAIAKRLRPGGRAARLIRPLLTRFLPDAPTAVVIRSGAAEGLRIVIFPQTEKSYWSGAHEVAVQRVLVSALRNGAVFWDIGDIGAPAGFVSLLGSRLLMEKGEVHAFEPIPDNCHRLRAAIALSDITNATVHQVAISAEIGQLTLSTRGPSLMWSAIPVDTPAAVTTVRTQTMDAIADQLGPPDVVKIDVEGAEISVLEGPSELCWRRGRSWSLSF